MLESLVKPKQELTTVTEDTTLQEALTIIEDFNFRALPILDQTGHLFRGAIYKMHLYEHRAKGGDMHQPVTSLMRNMTKFIGLEATFYDLIFTLRDLPFISVLDQDNHFVGIITHSRTMMLMADSWRPDNSRYTLTIVTNGERGSLERASKSISRYTNILSAMTLNPDHNQRTMRLLFTLPNSVDEATLSKIIRLLSRKGYHLEQLEDYKNNPF